MSRLDKDKDQERQDKEMAEQAANRQTIERFMSENLRETKRIKFIIFRQSRSLIARSILGGTIQLLRVLGLDHDKHALDDMEQLLRQKALVVGDQTFQQGRRSTFEKQEFIILENYANTTVQTCIIFNVEKTQIILGFNASTTVVNYEQVASEFAKKASSIVKIMLMQPQPPQPTPVFDFENEHYKNSPLFFYNGMLVEKAIDHGSEPQRANKVVFVYLSPSAAQFEWYAMQLNGLQKRFDQMALYVMVQGFRPETAQKIQALSPFVSKLNLLYDSLGLRKPFMFHVADEKNKKYGHIAKSDSIDELYQVLLDLLSGGQESKQVEEDNEFTVQPDGQGCLFMGIPIPFANPDTIEVVLKKDDQETQEATQAAKPKRRLKDNATSNELIELDEEEQAKLNEQQQEPQAEPQANEEPEQGEKKRDPLNTYVVAFFNPRDRDFPRRIQEFLSLAEASNIKALNEDIVEDDFKPYLRLYTCIQGTKQITLNSFMQRIPNLLDRSKVLLDNDILFQKVQAIFNMYEARDTKLGMFYIFNRTFKEIFEGTDFDEMKNLVQERGKKRKVQPKLE